MSIIIMLLLISILILVHEAGHFMAARIFKMRVDKFGFGLPIGPTLFKTKWGDTEILVHAFLLGGYISFPDDEKECGLPDDSPERFQNRPPYQRAIVVSAGVVSNIIWAFIFVFMTAAIWGYLPSGKFDIYVNDIVAPKNESVWQSGMQKGDKINSINGEKISNTFALLNFVKLSKTNDSKVDPSNVNEIYAKLKSDNVALNRDEIIPPEVAIKLPENILEKPIKLDSKVLKGIKYHKDNQINLSKKQQTLRDELSGEKVYISDGTYTLGDLSAALADNYHPLKMTVLRDGKVIELNPIQVNKKGLLGIKLESKEILIPTKTPLSIIKKGTKYLYDSTYALVYGLYQIFTGKIPLKDLHGIVAITKVGGDIIQNNGMFSGLLLTAVISMNLAIVNFLPIPALDGGHIFFLILEKLRGKPVDEKALEKLVAIGFWFLIILMILVIFNDIFGLITKKF